MKKNMNKKALSAIALILCCVFLCPVTVGAQASPNEEKTVILGGMPFGVCFTVGEIRVKGFDEVETEEGVCSPAKEAGMLCEDVIIKIDDTKTQSALDVTSLVRSSEGRKMTFFVKRNGKEISFDVTPVKSKESGEFCLGIWIDDCAQGLGTVTFIEDKTKAFGGLGHGITDSKTGKLCDFGRGIVSQVTVCGVTKGEAGDPGELRGDSQSVKLGVVTKNTSKGVFGFLTSLPVGWQKKEIAIAKKEDLKCGGASVFCTVDEGGTKEYGIEITGLCGDSEDNRNFLIKVSDTSLIEKTGGIVRGMSGSPIVQNGKLIGAITHVLVDDPTRGYGIFIENMMSDLN